MQITVAGVTFFVGVFLVVAAIFGGGFQIKEVKIPKLSILPRIMSIAVGLALIALVIWFPQSLPSSDVPPGDGKYVSAGRAEPPKIAPPIPEVPKILPPIPEAQKETQFLGSAIRNKWITIREVKLILRSAGNFKGEIDDNPTISYSEAVMAFQRNQNIEADGLVGPITYEKLKGAAPSIYAEPK